jgi:hypothetical protein
MRLLDRKGILARCQNRMVPRSLSTRRRGSVTISGSGNWIVVIAYGGSGLLIITGLIAIAKLL